MLPGFNHNIRYRDRVFHVQTEDNGLQQPVLVTQVFIEGHVLSLIRTSYDDLMGLEEGARVQALKSRMQAQHKGELKRLVAGELDDRVDLYLGDASMDEAAETTDSDGPVSEIDAQLPPEVLAIAKALPVATPDLLDRTVTETPAHPKAAEPVAYGARTSVLRPGAVTPAIMEDLQFDELVDSLDAWTGSDEAATPVPQEPVAPQAPRPIRSIPGADGHPPDTTLPSTPGFRIEPPPPPPPAVYRGSAPARPTEGPQPTVRLGAPSPSQDLELAETRRDIPAPSRPPSRTPSQVPTPAHAEPPVPPSRRRMPSPQDTIVDVQLPAALRAAQNKLRNRSPNPSGPSAPSLRRVEVHDARQQNARKSPPLPPTRSGQIPSNDKTMLEIDPVALREALAKQRKRVEAQRNKQKPRDDEPRIVVSEPSLDDVIMSYLKDEE